MERLTKIGILLLVIFVMGMTGLVVDSCQNENNELTIKKDTDDYLEVLQANLSAFMKADIVTGYNSRGRQPEWPDTGKNGFQTVFVDYDVDPRPELLDSVKTPEDMLSLCQEYGAEFSMIDDGMRDDSIHVSVGAAESVLSPLAQESRAFLRQKGLSNQDMDEIMAELNTDNSCLITLAMTIAAEEERNLELCSNNLYNFNLFTMPVYAQSIGIRSWNCAQKALGINDFRVLFNNVAADTLTKAIALSILRNGLPKLYSWVGVAVAIVEFTDCMAHYERYY